MTRNILIWDLTTNDTMTNRSCACTGLPWVNSSFHEADSNPCRSSGEECGYKCLPLSTLCRGMCCGTSARSEDRSNHISWSEHRLCLSDSADALAMCQNVTSVQCDDDDGRESHCAVDLDPIVFHTCRVALWRYEKKLVGVSSHSTCLFGRVRDRGDELSASFVRMSDCEIDSGCESDTHIVYHFEHRHS